MVNYFFVIIKVIKDFERVSIWRNVKIAEKLRLSGITAAFLCVLPIGNSRQIFKKFLFMKMEEW